MTCSYRDSEGNKCTLRQLIIREPDWAVSRMKIGRYSQNDLNRKLREQSQLCAAAVRQLYMHNADSTLSYQDYEKACLDTIGKLNDNN